MTKGSDLLVAALENEGVESEFSEFPAKKTWTLSSRCTARRSNLS